MASRPPTRSRYTPVAESFARVIQARLSSPLRRGRALNDLLVSVALALSIFSMHTSHQGTGDLDIRQLDGRRFSSIGIDWPIGDTHAQPRAITSK